MDVFLLGMLVGLIAVAIIYGFWRTISAWLGDINAFNKPQRVSHTTDKTPADIKDRADSAQKLLTLTIVGILALLMLVIDFTSPEVAALIYRTIVGILTLVIDLLIRLLTMFYNFLISLDP